MSLQNRPLAYLQPAFIHLNYYQRRMICSLRSRATSLLFLFSAAVAARAQTPAGILPAGTPLPLQIIGHLPMRTGEPLRAELLYPAYADNQILLPAKTIFIGTVTELHSDHSR